MKRLYFLLGTLFILQGLPAAAKPDQDLLKAKYLYTHLAFHDAIPYYEKIADQLNDPDIYAQLGDCYRLTKQPDKAAQWYAKAVKLPDCPDAAKLHYGQVLMNLQQYDNAKVWLSQYQSAHPKDHRVANLVVSCEQAPEMIKDIPSAGIAPVAFNTNRSEFGPAIWKNNVVFTSDTAVEAPKKTDDWTGTPFYNIYRVTCDQKGRCQNDMKKIGGKDINIKYHDGPCTFTDNGRQMYFTRTEYVKKFLANGALPDDNGTVHLQIMVASDYDEATQQFKKTKPFPYNNRDYSTAHPTISPSGNTLVFVSDMPGGEGGSDLYICHKDGKGKWSKPANIGKPINTEGEEMFPYLADDNTLYFSSDGHIGLGGLDLYKAVWNTSKNSFGSPENLGVPVNSSYDDMSMALYADGNNGYFASNRPGDKGGDNIYYFNANKIYLDIKIVDAVSKKPLTGSMVALQALGDKRDYTSDRQGTVFTRLFPQAQYAVTISRPGYESTKLNVSTFDITDVDTIEKTVSLNPNMTIQYNAVVLDTKTKQPIDNPTIVFSKIGEAGIDSQMLSTGAVFTKSLKPNGEYHVYAVKNNYYSNEKIISTKGITAGPSTVINDTLYMQKLAVGEVYNIDNIYYDFDKANIREDAKPALNRLIELLNQYPAMHIQINSHTDCRGSDKYNLKLSDERAHSVINYLKERGIAAGRLRYKGYGESKPIVSCPICEKCTEEEQQKNRRTEFEILGM